MLKNQKFACTVTDVRDEILTFESLKINGGEDSLEDNKGFGALHPQFWRAKTATEQCAHSNNNTDIYILPLTGKPEQRWSAN